MAKQIFSNRLVEAGSEFGRVCVGIDPHAALLQQWGLADTVDGLRSFAEICVDAFAGHVAAVKPQVAFFERFGAAGFSVLEATLAALRERGTLVIADAKRGDIGSTMAGYASAWLAPGAPLEADALTLTPYLGVGSLAPAIELAAEHGKGVFVMAANSNPEAEALQTGLIDGRMLSQRMVDECAEYNQVDGVGHVGVVVGATVSTPPVLDRLNAPVLMPGVGAQGATMADAEAIAGEVGHLVFPSVSRAVLTAGPDVAELRKRVSDLGKQLKR
ncbi:orotidine-5'-phosphate decarboxylase [Corynebacterium fournieri]|uniref:orotidine-5'-phosphate decarboxylase n=1 Tax=Corynebacterium fournieri TaxID=1852390 RepID=UPI000A2F1C80|nr:orotidine-5'-phosphate decarboxylase [Corynebacterium fournieri]WJY97659.1 orotidine 5'-phosphate decarboxylase [Corynebacterium fournieri]